jgi:hypothetical protein
MASNRVRSAADAAHYSNTVNMFVCVTRVHSLACHKRQHVSNRRLQGARSTMVRRLHCTTDAVQPCVEGIKDLWWMLFFSWFRLCTTMHGFIAVHRRASLVARLLR